MPTELFKKFKK